MLTTQVVMAGIMTMTPIHMQANHHGLGAVGAVIGIHVGCMYLPSLITGRLVDRFGRVAMAFSSGGVLALAGLVAALAPGASLAAQIVALALLGLGWNFGLIAGTAMVVDATSVANRGRVQGTIDVLIALAGAGAGASSGLLAAATSFAGLAWAGSALALALLIVVAWESRRFRNTGAEVAG
ncbi:MFS transporter [Micrococcales bacterium 31B]|nr:MFS transporter [Micrococcales bacterium 31B]